MLKEKVIERTTVAFAGPFVIAPEKRRTTILYRLQVSQRTYSMSFATSSRNALMYKLDWQCSYFLIDRRQLRVLTNRK